MLPSLLITLPSSSHEISSILQEDPFEIFTSSLSLISPDAAPNEHGIPGGRVLYQSSAFGKIELELADPETKRERDLFAHYVWNASMLFGELIGGRRGGLKEWREASVEARESADGEDRDRRVDDMLQRAFEEYDWSVAGESVLELGAGLSDFLCCSQSKLFYQWTATVRLVFTVILTYNCDTLQAEMPG